MPINKKEITKAQMLKAMQCKSADELMALKYGTCFTIIAGSRICSGFFNTMGI